MARFSLFIFVLLIGLNMIIGETYAQQHRKRSTTAHDQRRHVLHLKGQLFDKDNDAIYSIEVKKESQTPSVSADLPSSVNSPAVSNVVPSREEIACLAACHTCVEDYPVAKKRAADNCGPMCDCADSCFTSTIATVKRNRNDFIKDLIVNFHFVLGLSQIWTQHKGTF